MKTTAESFTLITESGIPSANLSWLTVIRGYAAVYVVLHHAVRQVTVIGDHANDKIFRAIEFITSYGHYAVDIFIVLSGYCLMLPILRKGVFNEIPKFILRRFIRIGLPYYFALALSLLSIQLWLGEKDGSHWAITSLPVTSLDLFRHILFIHQMLEDSASKINPAHWSVGVEFTIYLFFPLLYLTSKYFGIVKTTLATILFTYCLWFLSSHYNYLNPGPNGTSIYYLSLFMMGATSAQIGHRKETYTHSTLKILLSYNIICKYICYSAIVATALVGFICSRNGLYFPLQIQSLSIGFFSAILLFLLNENINWKNGVAFSLFEKLGAMGFSIYLLHDPIVAIIWKYAVLPMNIKTYWLQSILSMLLCLLLTLAISAIFFRIIENPIHQFSKNFAKAS